MIVAEGVAIRNPAQSNERKCTQPLLDIHELPRLRLQLGAVKTESFGEGYERLIIVSGAMIFEDKIITIKLFVITQVGNVCPDLIVRLWILIAELVGGS